MASVSRRTGPGDAGILIVAALLPTAAAWLYFVTFAASAALPYLYAACKVVQFLLPVGWIVLVERGALPLPALPGRGLIAPGAGTGILLGGAVAVFHLAVVRNGDLGAVAAPRIAARLEAIGAGTPLRFLALALFLSCLHSFLEEYYWRWFLFDRLRRHLPGGGARLLSSLAFAAHHVVVLHAFTGSGRLWWATVLLALAVVAAGLLWARLFERGGSLYPGWISHTIVDLAIMAAGYDLVRGSL